MGHPETCYPIYQQKNDTTLKKEDENISVNPTETDNKLLRNYSRKFLFLVAPDGKLHRSSLKKMFLKCKSRPTFIPA